MSSANSAAANASRGNVCVNPVTASTTSKKPLRALSDADKKPTTPPSAGNRKTRHTASSNGVAAAEASDAVPEQPRQTKASIVEALLTREGGASLEALCDATSWQAHSCRAFLTGLRKKGWEVIRASDKDGKSIYLIAPDRPPPPPETEQVESDSR